MLAALGVHQQIRGILMGADETVTADGKPCVDLQFPRRQLSFPVPVGEETIYSLRSKVHRMGECAHSLSPVSLRTPSRPLCAAVLLHVRMDPAAVRRLLDNSSSAVLLSRKAFALGPV